MVLLLIGGGVGVFIYMRQKAAKAREETLRAAQDAEDKMRNQSTEVWNQKTIVGDKSQMGDKNEHSGIEYV